MEQITLDQWVEMKDRLKQDILDAQNKIKGLKKDFVRIGFKLRKIEELKLYEKDGYKTISEFAKAECNLSASDVTRFMKINEKYSINGYSEELREEFLEYGSSKLAEMLTLPDSDIKMLRPEAARESIRELKQFNKEQPAEGEADDIYKLVERFFKDNKEILNELYSSEAIKTGETEKLIEIVNPGGNKSFKMGLFFLMMYKDGIKIKKFGGTPYEMSWAEFFRITQEIFSQTAAGNRTYSNHFGEEIAPAQLQEKPAETLNKERVSDTKKIEKTEEQKYDEKQRKIDKQTKERLEKIEDKKKMSVLPSERPKEVVVHQIRLAAMYYDDVAEERMTFLLRKKDKDYKVGDMLEMMEFKEGKNTGRTIMAEVIYLLEDYTGLVEDYCIMGIKVK